MECNVNSIYFCFHCGRLITNNPYIPTELKCECKCEIDGQYLPIYLGDFIPENIIGFILITSDIAKRIKR